MNSQRICFLGLENLPALSAPHSHLGVGGEAIQQSLIARALARRGFAVQMVVHDLGQPDDLVIDGVRLIKTYRPNAGLPMLRFVYPRWISVMRALRAADAGVYYTSCAGINVAQIAIAARARRAHAVFRIASDSDCDPERLIIPYGYGKVIYGWGITRIGRVLAQSEAQQQAMAVNYGVGSSIAGMLVDRGDDSRLFEDRRLDVLWVGNLRRVKRPDLMLALAREVPDLSCEMVGGTQPREEALFDETRAAAAELPNLRFAGPLPYAQVGPVFENARVFVNTSDMEGFPNTYLQAWARGVPVVAFFDPDGVIAREGLGHAAQNLDDMRQHVARLARDPELWNSTSKRCRAFIAREFPEDRILRPYLEALQAPASPSLAGEQRA
jgi:glycosyltransferase involved in cell wall biosynthesis